MKDGSRQVRLGCTFVDQRLYICFGKDAAARGDIVDSIVVTGILIDPVGIGFKKRSHLIDERSCTACADTVHALFDIAVLEIDDLGILAAEFDRDICCRLVFLQRSGDSDHFLNERDIHRSGQSQSAGTGDDRSDLDLSELMDCTPDKV